MLIAIRLSLVLVLTCLGVFASVSEVEAGRFCRKAVPCPCVQSSCSYVEMTPCVPLVGIPVPEVSYSVTGPKIKGNCTDAATGQPLTLPFKVRVYAITGSSGGEYIPIATLDSAGNSTGFYQITSYSEAPSDGYFYVEFNRQSLPGSVFQTTFYPWNVTPRVINPAVPSAR